MIKTCIIIIIITSILISILIILYLIINKISKENITDSPYNDYINQISKENSTDHSYNDYIKGIDPNNKMYNYECPVVNILPSSDDIYQKIENIILDKMYNYKNNIDNSNYSSKSRALREREERDKKVLEGEITPELTTHTLADLYKIE